MALDMEQRITLSLALQRYIRARERLEEASSEFSDACQVVRQALVRESKLIANVNHKVYLVTADKDGGFDIEQIESI